MTKRIYIQLLAFIAIICYPNNISANDYSLIPSTGQKVYVPLNATSAKGILLSKISITRYLFKEKFYKRKTISC